MPHKLLITRKMKPPSRYKKFLSEVETVHGKVTIHVIEITNIGEKLVRLDSADLKLERPTGMGNISATSLVENLPQLKPGETHVIEGKQFVAVPGIWVLTIEVKCKDKEPIEYYMSEDGEAEEKWSDFHYVVDRHQLELRFVLEKLLKKKV